MNDGSDPKVVEVELTPNTVLFVFDDDTVAELPKEQVVEILKRGGITPYRPDAELAE